MKKSFIHQANKKREGQSDTQQLIEIKSYLRKKYKIDVKREPYLLFNLEDELISIKDSVSLVASPVFKVRNPDLLWIDKYGMWIIEIDGMVHLRNSEKTEKRNKLYLKNNIKLIVVSLYELPKNTNVYNFIDEEIKRIRNG